MPNYIVKWEIDIEADTPREAAQMARKIQLRPDSTATVFDVQKSDTVGSRSPTRIDLIDDPE